MKVVRQKGVDKDNSLTVGEVVVERSSESILRSSIFETGEQRVQFFWHVKSRNFPLNVHTNMTLYNLEKQNTHNKHRQSFLHQIFKLHISASNIYGIKRNQEFRLFQILQRTCLKML